MWKFVEENECNSQTKEILLKNKAKFIEKMQ